MESPSRLNTSMLRLCGFLCISLGLSLLALSGCGDTSSASQAAPEGEARAPDFEARLVSGDNFSLTQLRGEPVILNFWASWCGPCARELPLLDRASAERVAIVAVNIGETEDDLEEFLAEHPVSLPVAFDPAGKVARLYRVSALPTTFFLDKQGVIRYKWAGELTQDLLDVGLKAVR
ncbi:MAG: TlpA family protein disulfide reductase [Ardenticatenaceae bacterium]|nr:TlpA family protein disulfide reductase [Ardenticatenaceae bacterium]